MQVPQEDIFAEGQPWTCTTCTFRNTGESYVCDACGERSHLLDVSLNQLRQVANQLGYPFIGSFNDLDTLPKANRDEFSLCITFHPDLIVALVKRGCFPMTTSIGRIPVMAIKLHRERSIIDLRFLSPHVQNKTKKHSNRYRFAINADDGCFDRAVAMLDRRHKNNWMSSMLVQSLKRVYLTKPDELRMLVWEVWNREDVLVAVEIGYLHGKIYTSMSGAFEEDGAGSVQLAVTAGWLLQSNVLIWDFGMQMEYKQGLGAKTISRSEWLDCVAACGGKVKINPHESEKTECATLARTKKRFADIESLSVGELRHVAKLLKIDLHGLVEKGEMVNAVKSALNR